MFSPGSRFCILGKNAIGKNNKLCSSGSVSGMPVVFLINLEVLIYTSIQATILRSDALKIFLF